MMRNGIGIMVITTCMMACHAGGESSGSGAADVEAEGAADATELDQVRWQLSSISGTEIPADLDSRQLPWLKFDAEPGTVSGYSGCNQFNGKYAAEKVGEMALGAIAMTRRYCPQTAALERAFVGALEASAAYEIAGNTLNLLGAGAETAVLARFAAVEAESDPESD